MFHQGRAAAQEGENHDEGAGPDQDVHPDVVLVDVQQPDPLVDARLGPDVDREGEQPGADDLGEKERGNVDKLIEIENQQQSEGKQRKLWRKVTSSQSHDFRPEKG